jgi:transcription antitermination factor NusG
MPRSGLSLKKSAPAVPKWYIIHLFIETEKFITKYHALSFTTRKLVKELLYFKKPDKGLYEREGGGAFAGYVFVEVYEDNVKLLHRALRQAAIGEILGYSEGVAKPLSQEEIDHIMKTMQSGRDSKFQPGQRVRIKTGPYEGMDGTVVNIVGQSVSVKVQLLRSSSVAETEMANLEEIA